MKKMLTLVLVLAIASLANAALNIYITDAQGQSEISMMPSNDVELLVWYTWDEGTLGGFDIEIGSDNHALGTLAKPTITATGRDSAYDWSDAGFVLDWEIVAASAIGGGLTKGILELVDPLDPTKGNVVLNPLARVLFTCSGEGNVTINGLNTYTVNNADPRVEIIPTMHSMLIHQVPEPITMSLLGLGGLFLRRRK